MTVGIINTSISVSNPDVTDESFSVNLIAVDIFLSIPDISIGDLSLRDSRSAILLEIRFTCDPPYITARHVIDRLALVMIPWRSRAEYILLRRRSLQWLLRRLQDC